MTSASTSMLSDMMWIRQFSDFSHYSVLIKMAMDGWTVWSYLTLATVAAICFYLRNWFRAVIFAFQMPGPPALPLLGNALLVADHKRLQELGRTGYKEYGLLFRVWLTVIPTAVVFSPEHLQVVLSSKKNTDKIYFYSLLHNFLGQGLITINGDKWRYHRRIIQPSFHVGILEGFIQTFHESAKVMVDQFNARSDLNEINITSYVNNCVFNVLHAAVLGIPIGSKLASKEISPFRWGKLVAPYRMAHPWLLLNWVYKHTDTSKNELEQQQNLFEFTSKIVQERRKTILLENKSTYVKEGTRPTTMLDFMLDVSDVGKKFSESEMVHELCTFMLAGQDSVGGALAFLLFELAKNPEIQERVVEEINLVFGNDTRTPTMNDLRQLSYLDRCIKESNRIYPTVPFIMRTLAEDVKLGKIVLPTGCGVLISPFATHRLPEYFPDPEKFDPDRFLPEQVEKRHPYAYIPFSAGPRNCIGNKFAYFELKTVVSTILRNFSLSVVPGRESLKLTYRITTRASGGVWVNLKRREK